MILNWQNKEKIRDYLKQATYCYHYGDQYFKE